MGLAFLAAAAFWLFSVFDTRKWHEHHPGTGASGLPDPLWIVILWIALPLLPFVLSYLLLSARREEAIAVGAGLAAVLFVDSLIFALAAAVGFVVFGPEYYALPTAIAILIFIICSL